MWKAAKEASAARAEKETRHLYNNNNKTITACPKYILHLGPCRASGNNNARTNSRPWSATRRRQQWTSMRAPASLDVPLNVVRYLHRMLLNGKQRDTRFCCSTVTCSVQQPGCTRFDALASSRCNQALTLARSRSKQQLHTRLPCTLWGETDKQHVTRPSNVRAQNASTLAQHCTSQTQ